MSTGEAMTVEERLQTALRAAQPGPALRLVVEDLARTGSSKTAIYEMLEHFLVQRRTHADFRESDEETVLDVLDALTGWCHPSAALLPEQP
jgi:hypothetical protein